jgi:pyoverdine/dityrosine biosynthesis protein Dit1
MKTILFSDYIGIDNDHLLKVKLNDRDSFIYGNILIIGGIQPYSSEFNPSNSAYFSSIIDLEKFKTNTDDESNFEEIAIESVEVYSIEIINKADI